MSVREGLDYDHTSRISRWPPGTRMAYCNAGPGVAASVVEKISGQRFEDFVQQNLFTPHRHEDGDVLSNRPRERGRLCITTTARRLFLLAHSCCVRPGAINASANDMAAYVQFYLNRGAVRWEAGRSGCGYRSHGKSDQHLGSERGAEGGIRPEQLLEGA